jgi:hypothetical protein
VPARRLGLIPRAAPGYLIRPPSLPSYGVVHRRPTVSEFLNPFVQWVGIPAAVVAGLLVLEFGLRTLTDRLTAERAR